MASSPFPKSASAAGEGRIVADLLPSGEPGLEVMSYQYPLKLISPSAAHQQHQHQHQRKSVLVFLLSYGGGLVGGDRVSLSIEVRPRARLSIVTQGHTKVFKSARRDVVTRQALRARVADGAALCMLPDPVQPFAGSVFEQTQVFRLAGEGASLCLLDWVTQGRLARGEDWSFARWVGRNEVWWSPAPAAAAAAAAAAEGVVDGGSSLPAAATAPAKERLLVRDAVILDSANAELQTRSLRESMHGLAVFGTLVLRGPLLRALGDFFLAEFAALPRLGARDFRSVADREKQEAQGRTPAEAWRAGRLQMEREGGVLWSAATVRGCVVVKFGAGSVEAGRLWVGSMLLHEGSVAEHFGDHALMCVR